MAVSSPLRPGLRSSRYITGMHHLPWTQSLCQQASARPVMHHRLTTVAPRPSTTHLPPSQPQTRGVSSQRLFTSSPAQPPPQENQPRSMSLEEWDKLSPEARIQWSNGDHKWGWVIYRCSYAKEFDGGWDDMKRRIQRMRQRIATESDAPEIAETMDFVFVEDPALEGASIRELQLRFQAWARADNTSPRLDLDSDNLMTRGSRYEFFLRVDGEGLWGGYVGLVPGGWPDSPGVDDSEWIKIWTSSVRPELYDQLNNQELWYAYYNPPEYGVVTGW